MRRGFTLIELLVVIAIIGLLASIVLVSLQSARAQGRDAQRVTDLDQLKKALELYYEDNGKYPDPTAQCGGTAAWSSWGCWSTLLPAKYIAKVSTDPLNVDLSNCGTTANCHIYHYCMTNSGQGYVLAVNLEHAPSTAYGSPPLCATGGPNQYWISSN